VIVENIQILHRPEIYRNQPAELNEQAPEEAPENVNDEAQAAPETQNQGGFFNGLFRN